MGKHQEQTQKGKGSTAITTTTAAARQQRRQLLQQQLTPEREAGQRQHVLNTFNDNYKNNNNRNSNNDRKDRNNNKSKNDSVSVVGNAGSWGGGRREQKRLN